MIERYLPDIDFGYPLEDIILVPPLVGGHCGVETRTEIPAPAKIYEFTRNNWDFSDIVKNFMGLLVKLENIYDRPFPINNMAFQLVDRQELIPKSDKEREDLKRFYGPDFLDYETLGNCTRIGDQNILRIGYKGLEGENLSEEVLEIVAHEYGHTLGFHLDIPVLEELKAYSFQSLTMRTSGNKQMHAMDPDVTDDIHGRALNVLSDLQAKRVREEEILSHITGENFGDFQPNEVLTHAIAGVLSKI